MKTKDRNTLLTTIARKIKGQRKDFVKSYLRGIVHPAFEEDRTLRKKIEELRRRV